MGDPGSISGRSSRKGNGYPFQYSCLEKSHGQRNLAGYIQSMASQRVGHDWVTNTSRFFSLHTCLHSNTTFNLADELFTITYNQPKKFESATSKITFSVLTEIFQNKRHQWVVVRVDPLSHIIPHYTAPNHLRFPGYADIIYLPGKNKSTVIPQTHTFQLIIMGWKNLKLKNFFPLPHFFLKVIMSKQMRAFPV